jgi:hypothetical protein
MGFVRSDVRDHIASQKNDHGPLYRHYRASQRRGSPKFTICEIFGVVRFSTFSTTSVNRVDWDRRTDFPVYPRQPTYGHQCNSSLWDESGHFTLAKKGRARAPSVRMDPLEAKPALALLLPDLRACGVSNASAQHLAPQSRKLAGNDKRLH